MAKLKIKGAAWSGVLEDVNLDTWTVLKLRQEIARRANCDPNAINLISVGRVLKDDGDESLAQIYIGDKVLASFNDPQLLQEEGRARSRRLYLIRTAAAAIAERNSEPDLPFEFYCLDVQETSGKIKSFEFGENHRIVIEALTLHTKAKRLMDEGKYKDALQVLLMAEDVFSVFHPAEDLSVAKNSVILHVDIVWCYFMLQDINQISNARERIAKALQGFTSNYVEYMRLRLDLLEDAIAYHDRRLHKSELELEFDYAREKVYEMLNIPQEALSRVKNFGFTEPDAKQALRIHNHDVEEAIDFLVDQEMKTKKVKKNIPREKIWEKKWNGYKSVFLKYLKELISKGYEKDLAAEALRCDNNNCRRAVLDFSNFITKLALDIIVQIRKRKRMLNFRAKMNFNEIVEHGFERSKVAAAFDTGGTLQEALRILAEQFPKGPNGNNASSDIPESGMVEDPSDDRKAEEVDVKVENELYEDIARKRIFNYYDDEGFLEWANKLEYAIMSFNG